MSKTTTTMTPKRRTATTTTTTMSVVLLPITISMITMIGSTLSFTPSVTTTNFPTTSTSTLFMSDNNNDWVDTSTDSNQWRSSNDVDPQVDTEDWQAVLKSKQDGSFWQTYDSIEDDTSAKVTTDGKASSKEEDVDDDDTDAWLDTLASLQAEEVEFNMKEADRADKARQMEEWGFDSKTIANTLNVATDQSLEDNDEMMQSYRKTQYIDDIDWKNVESHTKVEIDPDTNEPVRQQMVYVDEHTCIGCTNCAMIAQSTFFMHDEHGRARVFQQWGDDEETIQVAIETCPVDCIHYVPYDELVKLEKERRNQNINFKARLVSQAEYGGVGLSHLAGGGGPNAFTAPQQISGNMKARCNNCPSRGCKTCPMFGVGKNPEYERKEKERKAKIERARLQRLREEENKKADL